MRNVLGFFAMRLASWFGICAALCAVAGTIISDSACAADTPLLRRATGPWFKCLESRSLEKYRISLRTTNQGFDPTTNYWLALFSAFSYDASNLSDRVSLLRKLGAKEVYLARSASFPLNALLAITADNQAVLAFAGSRDPASFKMDFRCSMTDGAELGFAGRIHSGFAGVFSQMWPVAEELIKTAKISKDTPLFVTGHSLGGALAVLAGIRLVEQGYRVADIYTYGQPRIGNLDFVNGIAQILPGQYKRIVNDQDPVPHMAMAAEAESEFIEMLIKPIGRPLAKCVAQTDYYHGGELYTFDSRGLLSAQLNYDDIDDVGYWHNLLVEDRNIVRKIANIAAAGRDHLASQYVCRSSLHIEY